MASALSFITAAEGHHRPVLEVPADRPVVADHDLVFLVEPIEHLDVVSF